MNKFKSPALKAFGLPLKQHSYCIRQSRCIQGSRIVANPHRSYPATTPQRPISKVNWTMVVSMGISAAAVTYFMVGNNQQRLDSSPAPSPQYASTTPLSAVPKPMYNTTAENIEGAKQELIELLGEDGVNDSVGTRISHSSTEWSPAPRGDLDRPSLVVYPTSTEEVSSIAKICHKRRIPMIGYSGGTSLEGTLASLNNDICINFQRMNKVLELHKDDMDAVVQPGVGYVELNEQLAEQGLFFPPDPGPGAQIGGMISQSCSGTNAYRYGTMKDWVLGLTVVLADGTVIKTRHRPRKSNAGYDLTRLFVGSEGTLGFVTEASIKLTSAPANVKVAVAAFPTVHRAVEMATKIVGTGLPFAAMELLDETTMRAVNEGGYCEKEYPEVATLFFKFAGTPTQVEEQIQVAEKFAKAADSTSFEFSKTDDEAKAIWEARKTALWSLVALKEDPGDMFLSADAAVPISRLGDIIQATQTRLRESGFIGSCLGHVGDGNFHTTVLYSAKHKHKAEKLISDVQRMAVDMGGTITGEHGIGLEFVDALNYELGVDTIDTMRQIKLALDPLCLLNPGKIFRLQAKRIEAEDR